MDFEKATRDKLRFGTEKGNISTEELWDFTLPQLNKLAKKYNKELKDSEEVDFLKETSEEDVVTKLRFNIVIHILEKRKAEKKARENATIVKAEKQRLLELKERKLHEADEELSIEELDKKLADLG